jgi:hypothetical protein
MTFSHDEIGILEGAWHWNEKLSHGHIELSNTTTLENKKSYWHIKPHNINLKADIDSLGLLNGVYGITLDHHALDVSKKTNGLFSVRNKELEISGVLPNNSSYSFVSELVPFSLKKLAYTNNDRQLIHCLHQDNDRIEGIVDYAFIRMIMHDWCELDIRGEGEICLDAHCGDGSFMGTIAMHNGTIQIPQTYNFIQSMTGAFCIDFVDQKILLNDLQCKLLDGAIVCKKATILYDRKEKGFFVHTPLIFQHIFLNLEKDVFAFVSGSLLLEYKDQKLLCNGDICIDFAQCKKNILSLASQRHVVSRLFMPTMNTIPINLNFHLWTRKGIAVETSFLRVQAQGDMRVEGSIDNPHLEGAIHLTSGILGFPHRPLYITRAKLYFLPHEFDPMIELIAKGKVKKYHITLRAQGSLKKPQINLESAPSLTEEQIITLLLAGSEKGSVALVMPTLVMQSVEHLLFGPEQSLSRLEGYFKRFLGPLRHIRFVPNFFDQTGRGGFRGAIEIDVSDRLQAVIQKNFSLSEDTRFEAEYTLSDDTTIRALKDERGDIGGEIEMRWKF